MLLVVVNNKDDETAGATDQLHIDKATVRNNAVELMSQDDRRNLVVELPQRKQVPQIQQCSPRPVDNLICI